MAVTVLLSGSLVESVKQDVKSLASCTNSTVSSLHTLLRSSSNADAEKTASAQKRETRTTKTTTASTRSRSTRTAKTKPAAKVTVFKASSDIQDEARLSRQEKLILATEVFNVASKTLSDALRTPASRRQLAHITDGAAGTPQPTPTTKTPLQPSSPNRIVTSPTKSKLGHARRTSTAMVEDGVLATAECARLSLSCLRTLKSEQGDQTGDFPNMQLEQGACILAGRLISLGLNDLAYKELRGLKRRIEQHLDNMADSSTRTKKSTATNSQSEEASNETMADLLAFKNVGSTGNALGLLVSFQANALRLILSEKRSSTIQKLYPTLLLSNPSSPARIIMAALKAGVLSKDKAAMQLQSLSYNLSCFCPSSQKYGDQNSLVSKSQIKPIVSLNIQLLALEIRTMWWKVSGHVCESNKELWDPLARSLGGFSQNEHAIDNTEFSAIYRTVLRLQSAVGGDGEKLSIVSKDPSTIRKINMVLGQLAQEAGCTENALTIYNDILSVPALEQSVVLGIIRCRIACLHIQTMRTSDESSPARVSRSLSEAAKTLGSLLKGTTTDMEQLLIEAAKLKKLAMGVLATSVSRNSGGDITTDGSKVRVIEYLQGFIRFLRRYVGRQPTEDSEPKEIEQFQHKLAVSKNIILAAIDSAAAVGKLVVLCEAAAWEGTLPMFSDCQRLLALFEPESQMEDDSFAGDNTGIALVKLSNVFWSRYLKERESGKGYKQLIPLLKQSANLLLNCSPAERSTGFAALKFERLAHLYAEGNIGSESVKAFHQSIHEHISTGILQDLMSTVAGKPAHCAFQDPRSEGFVLGRVLNGHLRVQLRRRNSNDPVIFDDETLEAEERGFTLEWQMGLLMDTHAHHSNDETLRSTLSSLLSTLLSLYTSDTYPIHRLRVMIYALRFLLEHPGSLEESVRESLISEGTRIMNEGQSPLEDPALAKLENHLKSCLRLTLGFYHGDIAAEELDAVVQSWIQVARGCSDWESVESHVGDAEYWIVQMKATVDYLEIRGMWKLQLSTYETLLHIMQLQSVKDLSSIVLIQSRLALQYCQLGNCTRPGSLLTQASQLIETNQVSPLAVMSNKLVNVEYLLETGSLEKAATALSVARTFCQSSQVKAEITNSTGQQKISWERVIADTALIHSKFFSAQGSMANALFFAKLSVRLNCRLWAKLEKISQKREGTPERDTCDSEVDIVTEGVANLNIKSDSFTSNSYSEGSPFWPHIASHHSSLMNLVHLSAHSGLIQDAIYYAEQAVKVNKTLNAKVRLIACQAQLGYDWIRGGHISEGQELLRGAVEMSQELDNSIEMVSLRVSLAALYQAKGLHDQQSRALSEAERAVLDLCRPESMMPLDLSSPELGIEEKMEKLEIQKSSRRPRRAAATTQRARKANTKQSDSASESPSTVQSITLSRLRADVLRQQASCSFSGHDFDKALSLLKDAWQFAMSRASQISTQIDESEHILADTIRRFSTHAVYCVLPESTLSLPSVQPSAREPGNLASPENSSGTKKTSTARKTKTTSTRGTTRSRTTKKEDDFATMLSRASNPLGDIFKAAISCGSTADAHAASRLMSRMSLLSNATASGAVGAELVSPANVTEIGRISAFERAQLSIEIDKQLPSFSDPLSWPTAPVWTKEIQSYSCSDFTTQYIDILPDNWNVISLSLSADRTDIVISKMHKDRTPFLLRLPLKRGESDDEDEEDEFTFDEGKKELQEIIKLANISSHDARSRTDKQSRKEWWATREALDQRLGHLLSNIENIWLGGFRGVFSPTSRNVDLLSRFGNSFQNVLDKHLPSRRKGGKAGESRLTLHSSVLELFTGIQDLESREDPEDLLMDLLYFVVDILQFHGERNAYDEIDFDMMVVDTLDALRSYHENVRKEGHGEPNHTILILDKALHLFPWESLPCLQGLPVSRMPSLQCIRDRIMDFRQYTGEISQGLRINRNSGTYILNPGGDLKTTQGTFEQDLSSIKGWTSIVNREPGEPEFKEALESRSLLLYFGHGSGAQYIRGRTIKRLDRCAVTFLMGCSSGALTEAGDYECYGTPMNYIHAGSPALVATLWDVTDKDIDRFAKSTFERWGLISGNGEIQRRDMKGKSRCVKEDLTGQDSVSESGCDRPVALDEAVTKSRASCLLRYLNGAAPVIYGVPVFLK